MGNSRPDFLLSLPFLASSGVVTRRCLESNVVL
jgi:hypothetical protein